MWKRLHVTYPLFLSDFNKTWILIFEIRSNIKFREHPSSLNRDVPCGRMDRHDEPNNRFSLFCERTQETGYCTEAMSVIITRQPSAHDVHVVVLCLLTLTGPTRGYTRQRFWLYQGQCWIHIDGLCWVSLSCCYLMDDFCNLEDHRFSGKLIWNRVLEFTRTVFGLQTNT